MSEESDRQGFESKNSETLNGDPKSSFESRNSETLQGVPKSSFESKHSETLHGIPKSSFESKHSETSHGVSKSSFESRNSETSLGVSRSSKSQKHVKRPMNAFMVWAHERRKKMSVVSPTMHHSNISKILGAEWKMLTDQEKMPFVEKAKQIHEQHMADNPDYKYRPQRKVRSLQKRPRPLPPPLPIAPIAPSRSYAISVTGVAADNVPFEIPIIGVTSVRAYTMEEYNFRQNSLPHLSQKASDFTTHHPATPKIRTNSPKISKQQIVSPSSSPSLTTTTQRPVPFSLKPLVSGLKFIPTSTVVAKVSKSPPTISSSVSDPPVATSTTKVYIPNAKEAVEYSAFLLGQTASTTKSTPELASSVTTSSVETALESNLLPQNQIPILSDSVLLLGESGVSESSVISFSRTESEATNSVVFEKSETKI